jgi:hypothetical protein
MARPGLLYVCLDGLACSASQSPHPLAAYYLQEGPSFLIARDGSTH